jgi:hypothetical protein
VREQSGLCVRTGDRGGRYRLGRMKRKSGGGDMLGPSCLDALHVLAITTRAFSCVGNDAAEWRFG